MKIGLLFFLVVFFASCQFKEKEKKQAKSYFDVAGYFEKEARRLTKIHVPIRKKVLINGKIEEKVMLIKNWEKEFGAFIDADINKASWKGEFKKSTVSTTDAENAQAYPMRLGTLISYTSNNDKIPVKAVNINTKGDKIWSIHIIINNKNDLYTSQDTLTYFPDSLYRIQKSQQIKLMEERRYEVIGSLVH